MPGKGKAVAADDPVRLDKWLWAARFFKTRSLAAEAIGAGHVHVNGDRAKPSRHPAVGDLLRIRTSAEEFEITVLALSAMRGPASVAQQLYGETEASIAARARRREENSLAPVFDLPESRGRPTKKWRRQLHLFERKQGD
ncbi:RNA-binding S4 domain-containing protein [Chitinimonas sp.]|uniref:RNA-binding S4 domain-containing protein n=1 Tax=Chitinimonas sp. TaxID=1934313 RepID=UPI0035AE2605